MKLVQINKLKCCVEVVNGSSSSIVRSKISACDKEVHVLL